MTSRLDSAPPYTPFEFSFPANDQSIVNIKSLNANQIEAIANKIAQKILYNLGPIRKYQITRFLQKQKGNRFLWLFAIFFEKIATLETVPLSKEKLDDFFNAAVTNLKKRLMYSFSKPERFVGLGLSLPLSYFGAIGVLLEASEVTGITLSHIDVPTKYRIILKLEELPQKSEPEFDLAFSISEQSGKIEFSREIFRLETVLDSRV